jgi:hypothetical protein
MPGIFSVALSQPARSCETVELSMLPTQQAKERAGRTRSINAPFSESKVPEDYE